MAEQSAHKDESPSRWRRRLAILTACCTFPLIFSGGLVTSKDAGLAVPDWPTSFGHNMFALPWSQWVGNVFYEHGHRLLGSVVGLLMLTLCIWTLLRERRRWLRMLVGVAFVAVCLQGLMGGLRVTLVQSESLSSYAIVLAMVHGCFAQAFFALITCIAFFHTREWDISRAPRQRPGGARIRALSLALVLLIYGQLILGAVFRHTERLLVFHVIFAAVVAVAILGLAHLLRRDAPDEKALRLPARLLTIMLGAQLLLGLGSWLAYRELGIPRSSALQFLVPTLHVALGALMLVSAVVLALRCRRLIGALREQEPAFAALERV